MPLDLRTPQDALDFIRDQRKASRSTRQARSAYAARCRSYYSGIQWVQTGYGPQGFLSAYWANPGKTWAEAVRDDEPLRTTLNKITKAIVQLAAGSNFAGIEVGALPKHFSDEPDDVVRADVVRRVANTAVDMTRLVGVSQRANFERYIDGMHGIGIRLRRSPIVIQGEDGPQETTDYELESFDFDGYALTLDPLIHSRDLRDHPWVIYSEVMTFDAAIKRYGPERLRGIEPDKLRNIASLMPTEMAFWGLSGGRLYTHLSDTHAEKGLFVHELYVRGKRGRFDQYYAAADGLGDAGAVIINPENGSNPYGGCGMPLTILSGDMRPGEIFSVSAVGSMIDMQDKVNGLESLLWQQLWDYTTNRFIAIDQGWFGRERTSREEIIDQIQNGYAFGNSGPAGRFQPPQMTAMPAPNPGLGIESDRYSSHLRETAGQTPLHTGNPQTHTAFSTFQTSLELVEMPEDDRRRDDVSKVEALLEVATGTMIRAAQIGVPTIVDALVEQGMRDEQIGWLREIDPFRLSGIMLRINPELIRTRSRAQARRDLIELLQYGGEENPAVRQALAELDFPVFDSDQKVIRYVNEQVAGVLRGQPYDPIPLEGLVEVAKDAIRAGMMSQEAKRPEIRAALQDAWFAQLDVELEFQGVPLDDGLGGQPQGPEAASMDELFGSVSLN